MNKKYCAFLILIMVFMPLVFAQEFVLIDFSLLTADIRVPVSENDEDTTPNENSHTFMDFSDNSRSSQRDYSFEYLRSFQSSFAIGNWEVIVDGVTNDSSFTREAPSRQWGTVLGVRIRFPEIDSYSIRSSAIIRPPFSSPFSGFGSFENGYGSVINDRNRRVRVIYVTVYGLNFGNSLFITLEDIHGEEFTFYLGRLDFDGWKTIVFQLPFSDSRLTAGYIRFKNFEIINDARSGDFIAYFKDVRLLYE